MHRFVVADSINPGRRDEQGVAITNVAARASLETRGLVDGLHCSGVALPRLSYCLTATNLMKAVAEPVAPVATVE